MFLNIERFNAMSDNNIPEGEKVWQLQQRLVSQLSSPYGAGEAKAMTSLIFHSLKGWNVTDIVIHSNDYVSQYMADKCDEILSRLLKGEPIQYILGEARFYGIDLKVDSRVLIPRPETAQLVDIIVKENSEEDLHLLDIGTGSGAIAIALARNLKFPVVEALDISEGALEVARENASLRKAKIKFIRADIFTFMPESASLDIIVSNPPYVTLSEKDAMESNVVDNEPAKALFVPDDNPLIYYSRIAEVARVGLRSGGRLYFEINPLFADDLKRMLEHYQFENVEILKDSWGKKRFAKCSLPASEDSL